MSVDFNYFSTTQPDALASGLSAVATSVVLVDGSTFPDPALYGGKPYTIILGYGTIREEVCTVTAKPSATTLTVTRGQDGTPATIKNAGDVVVHGVSARDFRSINDKVDLAGDTMTGPLVLSGAPTIDLHAATKKYVDDIDAANDAALAAANTLIAQSMPLGAIIAYAGTTAPTGWHLCDGTAHGSSALTTLLGSANTPDLRGRFIAGAGGSYARGATGGADTVTLTAAQSGLVGHSHSATSAGESQEHSHSGSTSGASADHSHYVSLGGGGHGHNSAYGNNWQGSTQDQNPAGTDYGPIGWNAPNVGGTFTDGGHGHAGQSGGHSADHSHSFTTGGRSAQHDHGITVSAAAAASASASHENRPPYYALVYIIKKA